VNRIGDQLKTLEAMRSMAARCQQEAIDRTLPIASQAAVTTSAAINYLNGNHRLLLDPHYIGYSQQVGELPHDMRDIVDAHLKIGGARDRIRTVEETLADPAEIVSFRQACVTDG